MAEEVVKVVPQEAPKGAEAPAKEHKTEAPKAHAEHKAPAPKTDTSTTKAEAKPEHKNEAKGSDDKKVFPKKTFSHGQTTHEVSAVEEKKAPVFVKKVSQFSEYKLFNKWSMSDVYVTDPSLAKYINLDPIIVPHTFGRKTQGRFAKANLNIVERLINKSMRSGQGKRKLSGKFIRGRGSCGKKVQAMQIVERAFEIVEKQTKKNPIQVLVNAIENAAPREDITRIKRGGVAYSLAVDVSPMKRLDEAVKNIALAAFGNSFNKKVSAESAMADEIIAAANNDIKSSAIKRKDEVERIAKASR